MRKLVLTAVVVLLTSFVSNFGCTYNVHVPNDTQRKFPTKLYGVILNGNGSVRTPLYTVEIHGKQYFITEQYQGYAAIGPEVPAEVSTHNESSR